MTDKIHPVEQLVHRNCHKYNLFRRLQHFSNFVVPPCTLSRTTSAAVRYSALKIFGGLFSAPGAIYIKRVSRFFITQGLELRRYNDFHLIKNARNCILPLVITCSLTDICLNRRPKFHLRGAAGNFHSYIPPLPPRVFTLKALFTFLLREINNIINNPRSHNSSGWMCLIKYLSTFPRSNASLRGHIVTQQIFLGLYRASIRVGPLIHFMN